VIDPRARLHPSVNVGPYAVIDAHVTLGQDCQVGPHVHLTGSTTAGDRNVFSTGCVIGGPPQDLRFHGGLTRVDIGDDNTFREHVTIHGANADDDTTRVGSHNLLMAHCHLGHNCRIGHRVIIANGALLAGFVSVDDRAFISGNCLIHQFVRVGSLALMQGGAAISLDLAPGCIARGDNGICGLNVIGLRRAGLSHEERQELHRLYRAVFRSDASWNQRLLHAITLAHSPWGLAFLEFLRSSRRGVVHERHRPTSHPTESVDSLEAAD
jgi:UDP-N-acetylglucosamine acyltransferase